MKQELLLTRLTTIAYELDGTALKLAGMAAEIQMGDPDQAGEEFVDWLLRLGANLRLHRNTIVRKVGEID